VLKVWPVPRTKLYVVVPGAAPVYATGVTVTAVAGVAWENTLNVEIQHNTKKSKDFLMF
jgi:hypothetical protein